MSEGRLAGRTAIVTGSGQNIGRAIARLFAREGASVVVNGHSDKGKVDAVVGEITAAGGRAIGVMTDVSDPDQVKRLVAETEAAFGTVDIAVSNVGRRLRQSFEDITIDDWRDTINHNLSSVFYMAHYVLPRMRERGFGRIINISGYDGFTGHMDQRAHNVTAKAGMHGLTKAIAREYGIHGVTSNTVAPGAIDTVRDRSQYAHVNLEHVMARLAIKHAGDVDDIAEACLYLAGDSGKYVTGQVIHVNGGEFMF
ncbi:SDR family NAD(P)-dependent oxidoreductase [Chelatococcus reniformis]|uniref:3-oxoacyl-ACP reductase n=1 Tax=Chelatococcus reniformis TaxID=1494448 RepID=A0A916XBH8_9HYPH|nr:SDR family NAD(P)-dependent oxidoreductase [Chelatococcus reniformis]GGC59524.1 3-oxoacyl-ACP reductase [Chelatococcus reniformis]